MIPCYNPVVIQKAEVLHPEVRFFDCYGAPPTPENIDIAIRGFASVINQTAIFTALQKQRQKLQDIPDTNGERIFIDEEIENRCLLSVSSLYPHLDFRAQNTSDSLQKEQILLGIADALMRGDLEPMKREMRERGDILESLVGLPFSWIVNKVGTDTVWEIHKMADDGHIHPTMKQYETLDLLLAVGLP